MVDEEQDNADGHAMSAQDKRIAEYIAQHVIARALVALQDPDVSSKVVDNWAGHVQKIVGRAVIRLVMYLCIAAVGITGLKLGIFEKLFK